MRLKAKTQDGDIAEVLAPWGVDRVEQVSDHSWDVYTANRENDYSRVKAYDAVFRVELGSTPVITRIKEYKSQPLDPAFY
jgi:hypothetical protein